MTTARFEDSPTEFAPVASDATLVRGRPIAAALKPQDADMPASPIARLILSHERSRKVDASSTDAGSKPVAADERQLPVVVLTQDELFGNQVRAAVDSSAGISVVASIDAAAELAVTHRCPILITDMTLTRSAIEAATARLRAHDCALVFIVAGTRDQGGSFISLQSSGAVDGFLLKPATAGATRLVIESATKRYRAATSTADAAPTQLHARVRSLREAREITHPSRAREVTIAASPLQATHAIADSTISTASASRRSIPRPSWPVVFAAMALVAAVVAGALWERRPAIDPQQVIAKHLSLALGAQQAGRWIGSQDSAVSHYQTVLALDPQNLAAQRGLDLVAAELSKQTQALMVDKRLAEAASTLERLRELQPTYAELPLLDSQLQLLRDAVLAEHALANATVEPPSATRRDIPTPPRVRTPAATRSADRPAQPLATPPSQSATARQTSPEPLADPVIASQVEPLVAAASITPPVIESEPIAEPVAPAALSSDTTPANAPQTVTSAATPKLQHYVAPIYPAEAMARGLEGWVQVSFTITPAGRVMNARIEDGDKRRLFSRAALAAVSQWQYEPRANAGEIPNTVKLDFQLQR